MSDRENPASDSDERETPSTDEDGVAAAGVTSIAPDPGDPGGMGGVRVSSRNAHHRPPGGVSPIPREESSDR